MTMPAAPLQLDRTPDQVLRDWPRDRPLGVLWSGGGTSRSRWTLFADTSGERLTTMPGQTPQWPSAMASEIGKFEAHARDGNEPPFVPGWLGVVSYELGRELEPHATIGRHAPGDGAVMHWQRFESGLAFDHERGQWWGIGAGASELTRSLRPASRDASFTLSPLRSRTGRTAFEGAVARAIEHIRGGDIYQVNLTHRLEGAFAGSSRALFAALTRAAVPWYGAYLEVPCAKGTLSIASVSPELFLSFEAHTRRMETRPMKGTRAVGKAADAMQDDLIRSTKDQAELAMIVDLMRNDLGRVCEARSIRVEDHRALERHASLLQTTATVSGTLAKSRSLADLLRATFPGGSITGAPKIRAMQIIEELEPVPRGPYCGSIGYVGDEGSLRLNIAIRTAVIRQRENVAPNAAIALDHFDNAMLSYAVGAGIVADSVPASEWDETLAKASVIASLAPIVDQSRTNNA